MPARLDQSVYALTLLPYIWGTLEVDQWEDHVAWLVLSSFTCRRHKAQITALV